MVLSLPFLRGKKYRWEPMQVSIESLSVSYGKRTVLKDLHLTINQIGTVTLLGSSGAGKSTFLRVLSGLPKRNGQRINGLVSIDGQSPRDFVDSGSIGFMFQEPSLLPHLTVAENIRLPLELRGSDPAYAEHLISRVGLSKYRDHLPRDLSGGMKTRVALARTLAPQPRLILLDEPFSSLDVAWRFRLYRELADLQSEIPTITILVTHDIQEALLLSNRILVLGASGGFVRDFEITKSRPRIFSSDPVGNIQDEFRELHNYFISEKSDSTS